MCRGRRRDECSLERYARCRNAQAQSPPTPPRASPTAAAPLPLTGSGRRPCPGNHPTLVHERRPDAIRSLNDHDAPHPGAAAPRDACRRNAHVLRKRHRRIEEFSCFPCLDSPPSRRHAPALDFQLRGFQSDAGPPGFEPPTSRRWFAFGDCVTGSGARFRWL